ncbi:MAG TPA: DUF6348 family protein [Vicinamibacterales bacterium]|nr:DUF6348 family protein [Vicinamibacterales bacterium]
MILSVVAAALGSAFQIASPVASDDLSQRCAAVLAALARASGLTVSVSGAEVAFPEGTVRLRARIEARQAGQGRALAGVAIEAAIDAHPGFAVGCVGVGRNDDDAVETAIQEWNQLVGQSLLRALVTREHSSERYTVGGFIAYPGAIGFRGQAPPLWSAADHVRLLGAFRSALPLPVPTVRHALIVTVVVEPGQMPQGEVRLDGAISSSLWLGAQGFDWPLAPSGYILKQFYILVPER